MHRIIKNFIIALLLLIGNNVKATLADDFLNAVQAGGIATINLMDYFNEVSGYPMFFLVAAVHNVGGNKTFVGITGISGYPWNYALLYGSNMPPYSHTQFRIVNKEVTFTQNIIFYSFSARENGGVMVLSNNSLVTFRGGF